MTFETRLMYKEIVNACVEAVSSGNPEARKIINKARKRYNEYICSKQPCEKSIAADNTTWYGSVDTKTQNNTINFTEAL